MTLHDLAKALKVSIPTVSRALNSQSAHLVAEPLRRRIQAYASKMDYRPNQLSPVTGLPALIVPMGFTDAGLPVGLELLGRPWSEPTLIRLASGFEAVPDNRRVPGSTPALDGEHLAW